MSIKIAVVGAGLGGLTAAAALHRKGLDVQVYERGTALREQGVGMHLGPNATRLLLRLGLGPQLAAAAVRPEALEVRAFADGALLVEQEMGAEWERRYAAPYLTVHRGELHRVLAGLVPAGRVRTGAEFTGYTETADGVRLEFADGSTARADVLIGADGVHSPVRRALTGPERPVHSGNSALRGLVAAADVPDLDPGRMYMFAGPTAKVLCYPVSGGRQFTYVAVVPARAGETESWTSSASHAELDAALTGWAPAVRQVVAAATDVRRWALYDREPLARWSTRRTTLMGDAAHPMLPHHGQGANQAIEDGVALAVCLKEADPGADGIAAALDRYETTRRPHTAMVQMGSRAGQPQKENSMNNANNLNNNSNNNNRNNNNANNNRNNVRSMANDLGWVLNHDVEANLDNNANNNRNNVNAA